MERYHPYVLVPNMIAIIAVKYRVGNHDDDLKSITIAKQAYLFHLKKLCVWKLIWKKLFFSN